MRVEDHLAADDRRGRTREAGHISPTTVSSSGTAALRCDLDVEAVASEVLSQDAERWERCSWWTAEVCSSERFLFLSLSFCFSWFADWMMKFGSDEMEKHPITTDISSRTQPQRSKILWRYGGQCCLIDVATPDSSLLNKGAPEGPLRSALRFMSAVLLLPRRVWSSAAEKVTLSAD